MNLKIEARLAHIADDLTVFRVLPQRSKRLLGPFCFLDHMGPVSAQANQDTDVPPHPHIGLSTLTYLFSGRTIHRDSIGSEALISPGDVNWMTAGKGVAHSERAHPDDRAATRVLEGLQFWIALPDGQEEIDPDFQHYSSADIPSTESPQAKITVVAGEAFGLISPVRTSSPLVLSIITAKQDFEWQFAAPGFELGLYVAQGQAEYGDELLTEHQMLVCEDGIIPPMKVVAGTRLVLFGGQPFNTPRFIWWNLVSSSRDRIEEAKQAWKSGTFPMVPGDSEFVPLPKA